MKEFKETITVDDGTGRSVTYTYATVPDFNDIPSKLVLPYSQAIAEAQLLESAIKQTLHDDLVVFAEENHADLIELLSKSTMGRSVKMLSNDATGRKDRIISACTGLFELIKIGVTSLGKQDELSQIFENAINRRNHIAHGFWHNVLTGDVEVEKAKEFLDKSREIFELLRAAVIEADHICAGGAIGPDGNTIPRLPPELLRNIPKSGKRE